MDIAPEHLDFRIRRISAHFTSLIQDEEPRKKQLKNVGSRKKKNISKLQTEKEKKTFNYLTFI